MKTLVLCLVCVVGVVLLCGCGDNIESTTPALSFGPPQNVKALSADSSTIVLSWVAPPGAVDPGFGGYIVRRGVVNDSLSPQNLAYLADSLVPGGNAFTLFSYLTDGTLSDPASITWAPAYRFDTPIEISEYNLQDPSLSSGFDFGSETFNPAAIDFAPIDTTVLDRMDVYLYGGVGQIEEPLALWSAHLFRNDLRKMVFSSVRHSSTTLNFPLSTFPAAETFAQDTVVLANNTIYYVRITGDTRLDTLFARVHVTIVSGLVFPGRMVQLRVSLQRVEGLRYAEQLPECRDMLGKRSLTAARFTKQS